MRLFSSSARARGHPESELALVSLRELRVVPRSGPGSRQPTLTRSPHPPRASSTDASHRAPLLSLSRARRSSTTRTFYERDRPSAYARTACSLMVEVRDRTPARLPPPLTSTCPIWAPSHPTLHLDCARSRACPVPLGTAQTASSSQRTVPPAGTTSRRSARSRRASRQSRAPRRASRSSSLT